MRFIILVILLTTVTAKAQQSPNIFFGGIFARYDGQTTNFLHPRSYQQYFTTPEALKGVEAGIEGASFKNNFYPFAAISYRKICAETLIEGVDPGIIRYTRFSSYGGILAGLGKNWLNRRKYTMESSLAAGVNTTGHVWTQVYFFNSPFQRVREPKENGIEAAAIPVEFSHGFRFYFKPVSLNLGFRAGTHFYLSGSNEKGSNFYGGLYAKLHLDI